MFISSKMVSQFHTVTNKSLLTPGPAKGLPGYNPFLTVSTGYIAVTISWFSYFFCLA